MNHKTPEELILRLPYPLAYRKKGESPLIPNAQGRKVFTPSQWKRLEQCPERRELNGFSIVVLQDGEYGEVYCLIDESSLYRDAHHLEQISGQIGVRKELEQYFREVVHQAQIPLQRLMIQAQNKGITELEEDILDASALLRSLLEGERDVYLARDTLPEKIWLQEYLNQILDRLQILANTKNIHIKKSLQEPKILVFVREYPLRRIIENSLENAIKHSPDGSPIWIKCSQEKEKVFLHISNTFTKRRPLSQKPEGYGIGIGASERIAQMSGIVLSRVEKGSEKKREYHLTLEIPVFF